MGLTSGQTYEFRVRPEAVNSVGPGTASQPASIAPATVPGAPRNLGGARGNAEITLSWDAPDDGGSSIERYEYKVDNGAWTSTGGKSTTYTVTGLTKWADLRIQGTRGKQCWSWRRISAGKHCARHRAGCAPESDFNAGRPVYDAHMGAAGG